MSKKNTVPIYLQVAIDVASRITREELKFGQKITGRSTLASEYNVSPETIRKAMKLLSDMNIVTVNHGKGIFISSIVKAEEFIERYKIKSSVSELKEELMELMKQRDTIEMKMNETMNSIIDYTSRFKNSDHIVVHEYLINYDTLLDTKTLDELDFKNNTGITLVGIRRNGVTILSPSNNEVLLAKDKLLYVGTPTSSVRLGEYIRKIYEN